MILPLYPTALVARQAADAAGDHRRAPSGFGVGISWQEAEYAALGQDVTVAARAWRSRSRCCGCCGAPRGSASTGASTTSTTSGWGTVPAATIPIWIGCQVQEKLLRRVARLADGWMPIVDPVPHLDQLRGYVGKAGP